MISVAFDLLYRKLLDFSGSMIDCDNQNMCLSWTSLSIDDIYEEEDNSSWLVIDSMELDTIQENETIVDSANGFKSLCMAVIELVCISIE